MRARAIDNSVFKMLESERDRCVRVIEKIFSELENLPRGCLGQRKVKSGGKVYVYFCLKYREGAHVKFEHISAQRAEELRPALERKKKLQNDLKASRKRAATINHILQKG
ncbi:hypothetical protein [Pelobacter propionicus]|nr:hypothetical protein [Pelobacter propionicus]